MGAFWVTVVSATRYSGWTGADWAPTACKVLSALVGLNGVLMFANPKAACDMYGVASGGVTSNLIQHMGALQVANFGVLCGSLLFKEVELSSALGWSFAIATALRSS